MGHGSAVNEAVPPEPQVTPAVDDDGVVVWGRAVPQLHLLAIEDETGVFLG